MKICERCGMEYEPTGKNQKYCSSCKNAAKKEQACLHKKEMNEKKRRRRSRNASTLSVSEVAKEARKHGMEYGDYVAWMRL